MKKIPIQGYNLPLDLVNTRYMKYGKFVDCLSSVEEFTSWLEVEFTNKNIKEIIDDKTLIKSSFLEVRKLRDKLIIFFENYITNKNINELLSFCKSYLLNKKFKIDFSSDKMRFIPEQVDDTFIPIFIILELIEMLNQDEIKYLKKCENTDCILMFIDKSGRRKWCSMKTCGNRMKAKQHYHKNNH